MITMIVNIYDQTITQLGERPAQNLNWQRVNRQGNTVLAVDFNTQSIQRDPRCQVQWNSAFWEDANDETGLEIGNNGSATHQWTRTGHEG